MRPIIKVENLRQSELLGLKKSWSIITDDRR